MKDTARISINPEAFECAETLIKNAIGELIEAGGTGAHGVRSRAEGSIRTICKILSDQADLFGLHPDLAMALHQISEANEQSLPDEIVVSYLRDRSATEIEPENDVSH